MSLSHYIIDKIYLSILLWLDSYCRYNTINSRWLIINSNALNISKQVFLFVCFLWWRGIHICLLYINRNGTVGLPCVYMFSFNRRTTNQFAKEFMLQPAEGEESQLLHILANPCYFPCFRYKPFWQVYSSITAWF